MNWVGGSRNRLVMKNDTKKQREFFAKRKLQQKLKTLGVTPHVSSAGDICSGSTDLLTLFVVNQIASKKNNQEPPKVAVFGRPKGSKPWRNEPLVLPMSPCSPSNLSLADSPAQFSVQEIRKLKSSQRITYGQLSPVQESAFSDNSASDYLPHTSPSTSFASGRGLFPLQTNEQKQSLTLSQPLPRYSPPPWDTLAVQQAEVFQPFSQPRGMTNPISWSVRSNTPSFHLETSTPSQLLFGSPKPDKTEAGGHGGHSSSFCLGQLETNQPTLDFPICQSEPIHLFEENVFTVFNDNTLGTEGALFGNECSKGYLRKESSVRLSSPQTVPSPQDVGMELSNGTHRNSTCLGENAGLLKSFEYLPSCSCRAGYLSSDSNDDESWCESCGHESGFYLDDAHSDNLKSASQRITVRSQPGPLTPLTRSNVNFGNNQNMTNEAINENKASGSQQSGSPVTPPSTHNSKVCRCKKAESRDAATQTVCSGTAGTCDVSTQCSFDANGETKAKALCQPAVDASQQFPVSESETDMETQTLRAPSKGSASKDGVTPWSWKESRTGSRGRIFNIVPSDRILQGPINPLLGVWRPKGKENGDESEQRGPDRQNLVKEESDEGREEVRGHTLSEEVETLREIADVLLLLRQK